MENLVIFPSGGGSVISTLQDEVAVEGNADVASVNNLPSDDQLFEKIESHLHEKIAAGDKTAPFLLGQFYYEEVCYIQIFSSLTRSFILIRA